jgi:hypothetical protein
MCKGAMVCVIDRGLFRLNVFFFTHLRAFFPFQVFVLGESHSTLFFVFSCPAQYLFPVFSDFFGAGLANSEVLVLLGDGFSAETAKTI